MTAETTLAALLTGFAMSTAALVLIATIAGYVHLLYQRHSRKQIERYAAGRIAAYEFDRAQRRSR